MTLNQYIQNNFKEGEIFSFKQIEYAAERPASVTVSLSRLVNANKLRRLFKGVYYRPRINKIFGEMAPSEEQIVKFVCERNNAYISGNNAYNSLGLTDQVPTTICLACKPTLRPLRTKSLNIKFKKAYHEPDENNIGLLQILDAINDSSNIVGTTKEECLEKIKNIVSKFSDQQKESLKHYSNFYPLKVSVNLNKML